MHTSFRDQMFASISYDLEWWQLASWRLQLVEFLQNCWSTISDLVICESPRGRTGEVWDAAHGICENSESTAGLGPDGPPRLKFSGACFNGKRYCYRSWEDGDGVWHLSPSLRGWLETRPVLLGVLLYICSAVDPSGPPAWTTRTTSWTTRWGSSHSFCNITRCLITSALEGAHRSTVVSLSFLPQNGKPSASDTIFEDIMSFQIDSKPLYSIALPFRSRVWAHSLQRLTAESSVAMTGLQYGAAWPADIRHRLSWYMWSLLHSWSGRRACFSKLRSEARNEFALLVLSEVVQSLVG